MVRAGETTHVLRLRGKEEFHHRLEALGFVEGAEVSILSRADRDVIVDVKGAQLAIDEMTASRIVVC
jgi:ferrous iron transport protein A